MKRLTKEEKYFISCFIENCNQLLRPSLGKTISLYTFLDGTSESEEEQRRQIEHHDPFLAKVLFDISENVDGERFYNTKIKELQKRGYSESPHFIKKIRQVSEWLWLVESDEVREHVREDFSLKNKNLQRKTSSFIWPRSVEGSGSRKNLLSDEKEKSLKAESANYEKSFDFELIKEKLRANLLTSSQILQILDQASYLELDTDQISFLKFSYEEALNSLKNRHKKIYFIDEKGDVEFKKQRSTTDLGSIEKLRNSLGNNSIQSSYPQHFSYVSQFPRKSTSVDCLPKTSTHLKNSESQKVVFKSFFCSRCDTLFKAPTNKQNILCPCCGEKIALD